MDKDEIIKLARLMQAGELASQKGRVNFAKHDFDTIVEIGQTSLDAAEILLENGYGLNKQVTKPEMHEVVNGDKIGLCYGIITIICDTASDGKSLRIKRLYPQIGDSLYDKPVTLNECLKIIEFDGEGVVTVIFEEPLKGEIYEYGNYSPECWVRHGTTVGYA